MEKTGIEKNGSRGFLQWCGMCGGVAAMVGCVWLGARVHDIELPASFQGTLPCVDCDGIETTVSLRPDGLYFHRARRLDGDHTPALVTFGLWRRSDDDARVVLEGDEPRSFQIVSPKRLRAIDGAGSGFELPASRDLERLDAFDAVGGPLEVRGVYVPEADAPADAGMLTECDTRREFAVLSAGASPALEQAYDAARAERDASMVVTFVGRLASVNRMDGAGEQAALVVESFERVWPGADCDTWLAVPLIDTTWRLVSMAGDPVAAGDAWPELLLAPEGRASGSGGCNRLMARYVLDRTALKFGPVAGTKRACTDAGRMELEAAFATMLEEVDGFRVERTRLTLTKGAETLAVLEARGP